MMTPAYLDSDLRAQPALLGLPWLVEGHRSLLARR